MATPRTTDLTPSSQRLQSLECQVRIPETTLFRELDGELVLLSVSRGTYFSLDRVGTRFWQAIQAGKGSLPDALARVLDEFEVDEERCRADLIEFVASLCEHGLLERVAPPAA